MKKNIRIDKTYKTQFLSQVLFDKTYSLNLLGLSKSKYFIITDSTIANLYLNQLISELSKFGEIRFVIVDNSETSKSMQIVDYILQNALNFDLKKTDFVVGFGGGIITDISSFVASILNRGTKLLLIPTTLLSMIDSCIGGKNGVNFCGKKNLIGTIYPANKILTNINFLNSLSQNQILEGVCEAIKIAICADSKYLKFIENNQANILNLESQAILKFVKKAIQLKNQIVSNDLKDENKRMILNFGHTFGHAIEAETNYACSHGIAVGMGIRLEVSLLSSLGYVSKKIEKNISQVLDKFKIPYYEGAVDKLTKIILTSDKKRVSTSQINMVIPVKIGKSIIKKIDLSKI